MGRRGGSPRLIPSYYHGWSPDGKTLAYCAKRGDNFDLYAIPVTGGTEQRLTDHVGYDDGPDYSPDGRWIYFNSDRSWNWDIWRIPADGVARADARAERITHDGGGRTGSRTPRPTVAPMLFISFPKGTKGHPADKQVVLRRMPLPTDAGSIGPITEVTRLFGGQGTMNVNSWSPDGPPVAPRSAMRPLSAKPAGDATPKLEAMGRPRKSDDQRSRALREVIGP